MCARPRCRSFAEVKRSLGADGDKLQGIFVTVDPERDTPEMLKGYMASFDPSFIALRGTPEQLVAVARTSRSTSSAWMARHRRATPWTIRLAAMSTTPRAACVSTTATAQVRKACRGRALLDEGR